MYIERSPEFRAGDPDKQAAYEAVRQQLELIVDKNRAGRSNVVIPAWVDPALNAVRDCRSLDYREVRR